VLLADVHQGEEYPQAFPAEDLSKGSTVAHLAVSGDGIVGYVVPVAAKLNHLLLFGLQSLRNRGVVFVLVEWLVRLYNGFCFE
jgi:hypothetical protein